jgi:hypothetical protein
MNGLVMLYPFHAEHTLSHVSPWPVNLDISQRVTWDFQVDMNSTILAVTLQALLERPLIPIIDNDECVSRLGRNRGKSDALADPLLRGSVWAFPSQGLFSSLSGQSSFIQTQCPAVTLLTICTVTCRHPSFSKDRFCIVEVARQIFRPCPSSLF